MPTNPYEPPDIFRDLYERLLRHQTENRFTEIIIPWFDAFGAVATAWFQSLSSRAGAPIPPMSREELWEFYAFSRVNQMLVLGFQPPRRADARWAPELSLDDYHSFIELCGMDVVRAEPFSPFFHEIVGVEQSPDDDARHRLLHVHWPAVMLGDMLISRAGVTVSAGATHMRKHIAENSTLYWEHWRRNRPVSDLSDGWGSNSQWRTAFRRDYLVDGHFHFNIDGKVQPTEPHSQEKYRLPDQPDPGYIRLSTAERIELLTHRSFVITDKPHHDLYPFEDTYCTPIPPDLTITRDSEREETRA